MSSESPHSINSPGQHAYSLDHMDGDSLFAQPKFQESLKFLDDVKKRFEATRPDIYPALLQALVHFNQAVPATQEEADRNLAEVHARATVLFDGHPDLLERFESSLPPHYFGERAKSEGQL